jgi:hypothetical protein
VNRPLTSAANASTTSAAWFPLASMVIDVPGPAHDRGPADNLVAALDPHVGVELFHQLNKLG